jgi:hypothetical protein
MSDVVTHVPSPCSESDQPVFRSTKPRPTKHPEEFAPLEHCRCDDELIHPTAIPVLNFTRHLRGRKSLMFEALFWGCFCEVLADSGATNSFVSVDFLRDNQISYTPVSAPDATLADGSNVLIVGIVRNVHMSIGAFKFKETFLVVDTSNLDVVLGMNFLEQYNSRFDWRELCMHVPQKGKTFTPTACTTPCLPQVHSERFEICSFDALSKRALTLDQTRGAVLGVVVREFCSLGAFPDNPNPLLSGPDSQHPAIAPLLQEYSDVLVSAIPGGLPPERWAADGRKIEHCIETAEGETPYAPNPHPFTSEEMQEIRRYIAQFAAKGWIVPSLSPWAAPVLFVPKKVDPVTGVKTWRMVIVCPLEREDVKPYCFPPSKNC